MLRRCFMPPSLSRAPVYSAKACMSASESLYHGPVSASTAGPASIVIDPRMLLIFHLYGLFLEDGISSLCIMLYSVLSVLLSPLKLRMNVYNVHRRFVMPNSKTPTDGLNSLDEGFACINEHQAEY